MKTSLLFLSALAFILFTFQTADARRGPRWEGSGGWGMGSGYSRMYDVKTVETVSGEVTAVEHFTPTKGMGHGIHLALKTATENLPVHLGPMWFVERQDVKIEKGDKVEVKGSRITFDGKPALIAATVTKGDMILLLRDDSGIPLWAGWRKR